MRVRFALVLCLAGTLAAFASEKDKFKTTQRLDDAAVVFSEIMGTPDKGIPQELLEKSRCVVIVPGLKKGAFILGAKYGKGFVSCRKAGGTGWTAPATVRVEGGSIGLQIGGAETDVVMLVMNERGMQKLMSSKFTLGGEGEVAARRLTPSCRLRFSPGPDRGARLPVYLCRARRCGKIWKIIRSSTEKPTRIGKS